MVATDPHRFTALDSLSIVVRPAASAVELERPLVADRRGAGISNSATREPPKIFDSSVSGPAKRRWLPSRTLKSSPTQQEANLVFPVDVLITPWHKYLYAAVERSRLPSAPDEYCCGLSVAFRIPHKARLASGTRVFEEPKCSADSVMLGLGRPQGVVQV